MSSKVFSAKWPGKCPFCNQPYPKGAHIAFRDGKYGHVSCNVSITAPQANEKQFEPSQYQSDFYDFIKTGQGNCVLVATAGAGKTTTIKHAVPFMPSNAKIAAIAFNKRNAEDFRRVMPERVASSTFHSLGLKNVKAKFPDIRVDKNKIWNIFDVLCAKDPNLYPLIEDDGAGIRKLVDLSKSTLRPDVASIAEHYGVALEHEDDSLEIARKTLEISRADTTTADFGDMLMWCAVDMVPCEQFDFVLQDEAQDATQAQIEVSSRSLAPGGRLLAVGDKNQAIYGWAGSAIDSIDQIINHHNATQLPLSITYRLPASHVQYVNQIFPDVAIEARPSAPDGEMGSLVYGEMLRRVADNDLVVCRVNAPLVEPAFELIRQGRKAVILGKDIGKGLDTLLSKMEKRYPGRGLGEVLVGLGIYVDKERAKLEAAKKLNQASTLVDQYETILALSDGCNTAREIHNKIDQVFSDDNAGVVFSSIHRAKGSEAQNVFFLRPDLCPHPMAKEEWQKAGEQNCLFVALTRAKNGLYFIEG